MLGAKINDLIKNEKTQNENKYLSLDEKKRKEIDKKRNDILLIIDHIKSEIIRFEHGKEVKINKNNGLLYVASTWELKKQLSSLTCADHIYSKSKKVDFFEFYSMKDKAIFRIQDELDELKQWFKDNELGKLFSLLQHDGFGQDSWNEFWLKQEN